MKLQVQNVSVELSGQMVLKNISAKFSDEYIHAVLGPNGAGKSVFARTLSLLHPINGGIITFDGVQITPATAIRMFIPLRRRVSYLWQMPVFFSGDVFKNVEIPLILRGIPRETRQQLISDGLKELEMQEFVHSFPAKLSGGQQQRVALLRSLLTHPDIFILDEPTANLDLQHTKWFEDFFSQLHEQQDVLIIWITHDFYQAKRIAAQTHVIMQGQLLESTTTSKIFTHAQHPAVHNYLQGILE